MTSARPFPARTAIAAICLMSGSASLAANQSGTLRTVVLGPASMVNTAPLDYGSLIPGAGGTVTINAQTGVATTAGAVIRAGGTISRARFVASGTAGRVVTLSVSPSPSITISNGSATMTINQLRVSVNGGGPQSFGPNHTLGPTGVINFGIGGRLNVGANQAAGLYTATFTLTMNYQ